MTDQAEQVWIVFHFLTSHEAAYPISNFLQAMGSVGVTSVDKADFLKTLEEQATPDLIIDEFLAGLSFEVRLEAYFPYRDGQVKAELLPDSARLMVTSERDGARDQDLVWQKLADFEGRIKEALESIAEFCQLGQGYQGYSLVKEEDWANNWKSYYQTLKFGRIVVNPSWLNYQVQPGELLLNLDPGSAFGTGSHESTALALNFLSSYDFTKEPSRERSRLLDLGTGSGILALAAAKVLPDWQVEAVDIDRHAVDQAKANAAKNNLNIKFSTGELRDQPGPYNIILANLIANLHLDLAEDYCRKLAPAGLLLASGIIAGRLDDVRACFESNSLEILDLYRAGDWSAILAQKS